MSVEFQISCDKCNSWIVRGNKNSALHNALIEAGKVFSHLLPVRDYEDLKRIALTSVKCQSCIYEETDQRETSDALYEFIYNISLSNDPDDYFMD